MSAAVVGPASPDVSPDAELIGQCADLVRLEAEWANSSVDGDPPARQDRFYDLIELVTDTPAQTEAGNRAKLAVVCALFGSDWPDDTIVSIILADAVQALALPLAASEP